jgi:putative beta-lysine N-acetyltransferase
VEQILESVRKKKPLKKLNPLPESITLRPAGPKDVHAMAVLYREVFESYPFPIHDPGYLRETMESHVDYFVAETTDGLVGISSAEKDVENSNVEMTDFAVHPSARGHGLAMHLLKQMEAAMREQQIQTAFTIARAGEGGMNATFARLGYHFGGQLVNNTQICGRLETMNVWHKSL